MSVVRPSVNLDVAGAAALEKQLADASGDLVIDMSEVTFVASSGLRVMLKVAQRLKSQGGQLSISNPNDTVREVFRISGFASVVPIVD
jgi:anti-anti-sigma factor